MRRVLIAETHPVARAGYRQILSAELAPIEFFDVGSRQQLFDALTDGGWDILLLDLTLPDQPGIEVLRDICDRFPAVPVLVVSSYPEAVYAGEAMRAGAAGFVSKASDADALLLAVKQVLSGGRYISPAFAEQLLSQFGSTPEPLHVQLSPREREVFRSLAVGTSITRIASDMDLSVKTVSTYRARILDKMGMRSNADITAYSLRLRLEGPRCKDGSGNEEP